MIKNYCKMIKARGLFIDIFTILFFFILYFLPSEVLGQGQLYRMSQFDVQHYQFNLELQDDTDQIVGSAYVTFNVLKALSRIELDLIQLENETGMAVDFVGIDQKPMSFSQSRNKLIIENNWKEDNTG